MAVEEVIGLGGGVVEPEGLGEGEVAPQRRLDRRNGSVGKHSDGNPKTAGGGGMFCVCDRDWEGEVREVREVREGREGRET